NRGQSRSHRSDANLRRRWSSCAIWFSLPSNSQTKLYEISLGTEAYAPSYPLDRARKSGLKIPPKHSGGYAANRGVALARVERARAVEVVKSAYYLLPGPTTFCTSASKRGSPRSGSHVG